MQPCRSRHWSLTEVVFPKAHRHHQPSQAWVFRKYDERIVSSLYRGLIYTRYVDDLTISCSARIARQQDWETPESFRDYALRVVEKVLDGSGFRINRLKTRVSSPGKGFTVTGVQVTSRGVDLTRNTKRTLRRLKHLLTKFGLADTAEHLLEETVQSSNARVTDVSSEVRVNGRAVSLDALTAVVITKLHGDLVIELRTPLSEAARIVDCRRKNGTPSRGKRRFRLLAGCFVCSGRAG